MLQSAADVHSLRPKPHNVMKQKWITFAVRTNIDTLQETSLKKQENMSYFVKLHYSSSRHSPPRSTFESRLYPRTAGSAVVV